MNCDWLPGCGCQTTFCSTSIFRQLSDLLLVLHHILCPLFRRLLLWRDQNASNTALVLDLVRDSMAKLVVLANGGHFLSKVGLLGDHKQKLLVNKLIIQAA